MSVEIKWIGHASFRIASDDAVVYIDPWKLADEPHDADVVFVSHDHHDHCSPDDVMKVSGPETAVVGPAETVGKFGLARAVAPGDSVTVGNVAIEAVAAYNVSKGFHPKANGWCGAVFSLGEKRIYYAGDTDEVPEMASLADVDVALLPVGGTYTMDAAEAAKACQAIAPAAAVGYHWGDIVGSKADAEKFADAAGCEVHVLMPGEAVTI